MVFGRGFNSADLTVIDQAGVITCSFNFKREAEQKNVESLLVPRPKDWQWSMSRSGNGITRMRRGMRVGRLNLDPVPSECIIHDHSNEKGHSHIPHGNSGHNEHYIKVGLFVANVLYNNGELGTGKEQNHS